MDQAAQVQSQAMEHNAPWAIKQPIVLFTDCLMVYDTLTTICHGYSLMRQLGGSWWAGPSSSRATLISWDAYWTWHSAGTNQQLGHCACLSDCRWTQLSLRLRSANTGYSQPRLVQISYEIQEFVKRMPTKFQFDVLQKMAWLQLFLSGWADLEWRIFWTFPGVSCV